MFALFACPKSKLAAIIDNSISFSVQLDCWWLLPVWYPHAVRSRGVLSLILFCGSLSVAATEILSLLLYWPWALASVLKQEISQSNKTRGKTRLTNMIKSGKERKVFSFEQKDLQKFTEQAKKYGVLYCVLRDKNTKSDTATIDIISRAEDAAKIQCPRIFLYPVRQIYPLLPFPDKRRKAVQL